MSVDFEIDVDGLSVRMIAVKGYRKVAAQGRAGRHCIRWTCHLNDVLLRHNRCGQLPSVAILLRCRHEMGGRLAMLESVLQRDLRVRRYRDDRKHNQEHRHRSRLSKLP